MFYKIQIITCENPDDWYYTEIGNEFEVKTNQTDFPDKFILKLDIGDEDTRLINKSDCKIISEIKPSIIRNKLQVYYKHLSGGKTPRNRKEPVRQVTGKKINKLQVRAKMINWGKLESFHAKSIENAERILHRLNINNISKAIYFDNEGNPKTLLEQTIKPNEQP